MVNKEQQLDTIKQYIHNQNYQEALTLYQQLLEHYPFDQYILLSLGDLFLKLNLFNEALECYHTTLKITPNDPYSIEKIGDAYYELMDYEQAADYYSDSLSLTTPSHTLLTKLGSVCHKLDLQEEAILYYKKSLEYQPKRADVLLMLGRLYRDLNLYDEALFYYKKALKLDTTLVKGYFDLSLLYLTLQHYKKGWKLYEYRLLLDNQKEKYHYLPIPLYKKKIKRRTPTRLFIFHEQGYGDSIQFIRYIKRLKKKSWTFSVGIQRVLTRLMRYNFPDIVFIDDISQFNETQYDYALPMMSIPYVLNLTSFKPKPAYLSVCDHDVWKFKQTHICNTPLTIGIAWRGSKDHTNDHNRSVDPTLFEGLFTLPNVQYYSLQLPSNPLEQKRLDPWVIDLSSYCQDFYDTAVIVKSLDLIISVDTALLHLAGALGVNCFGLIPFHADWRWSTHDQDNNQWYQSVRLFRQSHRTKWNDVFDRLSTEIKTLQAYKNENSTAL